MGNGAKERGDMTPLDRGRFECGKGAYQYRMLGEDGAGGNTGGTQPLNEY